jgi:hypothetical protein
VGTLEGIARRHLHGRKEAPFQKPSEWRLDIIDGLTHAVPYFVSRDVCRVLRDAAETVPREIPLEDIRPVDTSGLMYLEEPFGPLEMRALLWSEVRFSDTGDPALELEGFGGNPLDIRWSTFWMFDECVSDREAVFDDRDATRLMFAFFAFIRQKIPALAPVRLPRASQRRMARAPVASDPLVRVVRLRAREKPKDDARGEQAVDWSCRWLVRPHWRNQWYPKEQTHRPVLVPLYVKGPDNKPLRRKSIDLMAVTR